MKVIPLLKSPEWAVIAAEQNLLSSSFLTESSTAIASAPIIAYGVDDAQSVSFLRATQSNVQNLAEIRDQAFAVLRQRLAHVDWECSGGNAENVLFFAGDFNAAECILLPERLLEAHTLLQAPQLLACTPKRGVLLVCRYLPDEKELVEEFLGKV